MSDSGVDFTRLAAALEIASHGVEVMNWQVDSDGKLLQLTVRRQTGPRAFDYHILMRASGVSGMGYDCWRATDGADPVRVP